MPTLTVPYAEPLRDRVQQALPRRRLAPQMVFYTLLFSSVVTFMATAFQLYMEFARDKHAIDARLEQIEHSHLHGIALSLWSMDHDQIRTQLEGVEALPDIEYLEIDANGMPIISVGADQGRDRISRVFPLTYHYRDQQIDLGTLRVVASLDNVYSRLYDRVLVIFGSQAVKTFLVATFMLLLFQWLVVRHLEHLSRFVRDKRLDDASGTLVLNRPPPKDGKPDELDDVVSAFNDTCAVLQESYDRLARSEERFNLAMKGANDGLWDWDLKAGEVYFSPRWKDMLGYGDDELTGNPREWQERIHPEDRNRVLRDFDRHVAGELAQFKSVHRLRHKDGSYRWILSRGQTMRDAGGNPYRVVGTHVDVTAQKEIEARLAEATHRLQAEQEKRVQAERFACVGEMSASIAHEIRNPLSSILNSLQLLTDPTLGHEDRAKVADIVNAETRRLQRILEEFLSFARIKPTEMASHDLIGVLRETMETFTRSNEAAVNEVEFHTLFHVEYIQAHFDPDQVRQVAWNLLTNAVQAVSDGGHVTLATTAADGGVRVAIRDTGRGIPADLQECVTRPFVTGRKNGTGLGLAIVARILAQHGSELEVDSAVGRGTQMAFVISEYSR